MSRGSLNSILNNWLGTNDFHVRTKYAEIGESKIISGELIISAGRVVKIKGKVIRVSNSFHTHALTDQELESINQNGDDYELNQMLAAIDEEFLSEWEKAAN